MIEQPGYPPAHILRGLSRPRRIGYILAGLGGLAGAAMIGALWATEPAPLPTRTQAAFAALILVGLAWATFATWALVRRPLFATDRVIAASLAVAFSALTTIGTVAVAMARSSIAGMLSAAGIGLPLFAVAAILLVRARAYRAVLLARKRELQDRPDASEAAPVNTGSNRPPIGPLALVMLHRGGSAGRQIVIAAVFLGLALLIGIILLLS